MTKRNSLGLVNTMMERSIMLDIFKPLLEAMGIDGYGEKYENTVFEMHPYCWCDERECPMCGGHVMQDGVQTRTTFFHKPSGYRLHWYKYMMRAVEVNRHVTGDELKAIIAECIMSLEADTLSFDERVTLGSKRVGILAKPAREALLIRAGSTNPRYFTKELVESWNEEQCAIVWGEERRRLLTEFGIPKLRSLMQA